MGLEYVKGICYILCLFLPNTGLLSWSLFSPYWINDKSNNGTTECFRGVLFNVGCLDEDKRLGDLVLGLLIANIACIVLGLMAHLCFFLSAADDEDGTGTRGCCLINCFWGCVISCIYPYSGYFAYMACLSINGKFKNQEKGLAYHLCFATTIYPIIQSFFMCCVLSHVIDNIKKKKIDSDLRARQEVTSYVIYGSNPSSEGVVMD
ncbi:uncharacterized protein LOC144627321 [Crassostrea virginica]